MANNDTTYPILNPYTPLAFLPPDIADQYEAVGYVYISTLAVLVLIPIGCQCLTLILVAGVHVGLASGIARGIQDTPTRATEPSEHRIHAFTVRLSIYCTTADSDVCVQHW